MVDLQDIVLKVLGLGSSAGKMGNLPSNPPVAGDPSTVNIPEIIRDQDPLVKAINLARQQNNLLALHTSGQLDKSSYQKALDLVQQGYWDHVNPQGVKPWDLMKQAGYNYSAAGENLARNFSDNTSMMNAWMASPGHRENILNPNYTEIGVGQDNSNVATHFGRPQVIRTLGL